MVGPDFALGRDRAGTIDVMREIGERAGLPVEVAPMLPETGEKVGSSAIRQALAEGDVGRWGGCSGDRSRCAAPS